MHAGTVAVVLVAALAHAIWNTASKHKRGDTVVFVWAYVCAAGLLCVPLALIPVARGEQRLDGTLALASAVSAGLHLVYSLTLQTGYDRFELGVVYPVARGTGPLLTMLVAITVLRERPGALALAGAGVVIVGVVVVAGNPFRATGPHGSVAGATNGSDRGAGRRGAGGAAWGLATGATIAAYTLWDERSVTALQLAPTTYFASTFLLQALALTPLALRRRRSLRTSLGRDVVPIAVIAVFSPLSYVLVLEAMRSAPLALVAPLRESSIVIGSLLAWRLFHESHLARRLAGSAVVLAGIAAISV